MKFTIKIAFRLFFFLISKMKTEKIKTEKMTFHNTVVMSGLDGLVCKDIRDQNALPQDSA